MKRLFLLFLISCFLFSCSDDSQDDFASDSPSIVVISDHSEHNDILINVVGATQKIHPLANINFIRNKTHDLYEAAYNLDVASKSFPDNTYFIVIVEEGNDNTRMVFESDNGQKFLVPDNGIISRMMLNNNISEFHEVSNSQIFDGLDPQNLPVEDFYAMAGTALLNDISLTDFGPGITNPKTLEIASAQKNNGSVEGQVLFVDDLGDCHLNISSEHVSDFELNTLLKIDIGDNLFFAKYSNDYTAVDKKQNVSYIDASRKLNLSVNSGDMGLRYDIHAGDLVTISQASVKVGLLLFNKSSVVTSIIEDVKNELVGLGLNTESIQFIERDAANNSSQLFQLCNEILDQDVDVFVSVSTPASQVAVNLVPENIPLIFTYVTDPVSAGLLDKRNNISGLSDATNFNDYLSFVKKVMPNLSYVGSIYNRFESNSTFAQNSLISLLGLYRLNYTSVAIYRVEGINQAYQSVRDNGVGAILVTADNTVSNGMSTLTQLAKADKIPVIGDSYQHCSDGALASISVDYNKLAISTGKMLGSAILGVDLDDEEIRYFNTDIIGINTKTASDIGYTFPTEILNDADYIYP